MTYIMHWISNESTPGFKFVPPESVDGWDGGDERLFDYRELVVPQLEGMLARNYTSPSGRTTVKLDASNHIFVGDRKIQNKLAGVLPSGGTVQPMLCSQVCFWFSVVNY